MDGIDLGIEGIEDAEEIGVGGFAVVYRARQPAFGRTVAVKVMSVSGLDQHNRLRFERERKAMGSLSDHPGIVTVYDAGFTRDNRPYLVMAYLPRGSLGDRLKREGVLSWQEASRVAVRLAGALEVAHQAGVIHRDIKPANVLVSDYHEPMLADFGIARISGGQETRSGVITASIPHAAPEVLDGQRPTEAADIYSLGSTIYALIAGSPAFVRDTDESIMPLIVRINTEPVPSLADRGVPAPIGAVLQRSMAKDPAARHSTAAEFGVEMQRAQREAGIAPTEMVHGAAVEHPPSSDETIGVDPDLARLARDTEDDTTTAADDAGEDEEARPEPTPGPRPRWPWLAGATVVVVVAAVVAFLALRGDDGGETAEPDLTPQPATPAPTPPPPTPPPSTPPPEGPPVVLTEPVLLAQLNASDAAEGDTFGRDTATDGTTLVVGSRLADEVASTAGAAYVFQRDGDSWRERGQVSASDSEEGDQFGKPVAANGDILLVGSRFDDTEAGEDAGSAYYFTPDATVAAGWVESAKLVPSDAEAGDGFGFSMAFDGDLLVVGAPVEDHDDLTDAGAVYVFRKQGDTWVEEAKLVASDGVSRARFGSAVAVSGETVAVASRQWDAPGGSDEGAVYIFDSDGAGWTETVQLTADLPGPGDQFGWVLTLRGQTMVATAPFAEVDGLTDAGTAYVFSSAGGAWELESRLTAPEPQELGQFGSSVAFHGDRLLVGEEFADVAGPVDSGAVYGYSLDDTGQWTTEFTIVAPDPQFDDHFGTSVVVAGDEAIIGAHRDDTEAGENAGSLYVYALPPPPG